MNILQRSKLARPRVILPLLALLALSIGGYEWLKKTAPKPARIEIPGYSKAVETSLTRELETDRDVAEVSGKVIDLCEKIGPQGCQHVTGERVESTPVHYQELSLPRADLNRFMEGIGKLGKFRLPVFLQEDLSGQIVAAEHKLAALTAQQQKIAAQREKAGASKRQRVQLDRTLAELAAELKAATEARAQLAQRSEWITLRLIIEPLSHWKFTFKIG
jgi:hypothetical protein